jgi:ATP-dependent helicase/nuclease subunit B
LVVVPSQRAAAKLERTLSMRMERAGWLPRVQTLGLTIQQHGEYSPISGMEALALLYTTWLKLPNPEGVQVKEETKSFQAFMPWGQIALRDFNEIDQHLKPADSVFKNLCDIEGIEDWSFDSEDRLSEGQTAFLRQYLQLGALYKAFVSELTKRKLGYSGLIARKAAESDAQLPFAHIFVAGMSALTKAEIAVLKRYERNQQLTWVWDADASYVEASNVEAGLFIRNHFDRIKSPVRGLPKRLEASPPTIVEVNCSSNVVQGQYIGSAIAQLTPEERAKTAIILPDGAQLPLLLQSLPAGLQSHYNVTMGLSWNDTPARSFLRTVQRLIVRGRSQWHHVDIRNALSEPLLSQIRYKSDFRKDANCVLNTMASKKWAWVKLEEIKALSQGPVFDFFASMESLQCQDSAELLEKLSRWTQSISHALEAIDESDPWTVAGWEKVVQAVGVACRFENTHHVLQLTEDVWSFLFHSLQGERIDLLGEPEAGLQIMGLIESRALDYDRVFVMDCNEGTLPKSSPPESYIPFDLRSEWELPGRHEREAIFAYYTYRLLNRCSEIHLLYRGQDEAAEKSRYVQQLNRTFRPDGSKLLPIIKKSIHTAIPEQRPELQPLVWGTSERKKLREWAENGISPSAWNTFMNCRREFHYKYMLKLHEQDEFEDEMSASTFGNVVHKALEEGLKEHMDKPLDRAQLTELRNKIPTLLKQSVAGEFNLSLTESGENYLHFAIAKATLYKLIDVEIGEMEQIKDRQVLSLEESLSHSFKTDHSLFTSIRLHGKADRIDVENGQYIVTDYKTGNVKESDLALKGPWTEKLATGKAGKALQLLIYAAMALEVLQTRNPGMNSIQSGIRSGKNAKAKLMRLSIDGRTDITQTDARILLNWLAEQLEAVHENYAGLEHNADSKYCAYCAVLDPPPANFF